MPYPAQPPDEVFQLSDGVSDRFIGEWQALALETGTSYFTTPDWILSWWRHLARKPPTFVAAWRGTAGELLGVAAMSKMRERLHPRLPLSVIYWANAGTGPGAADHVTFPGKAHLGTSIRTWVHERSGTLLLRNIPPGSEAISDGLELVSTVATYERGLPADGRVIASRSLWKEVRRKHRRLTEQGVTFEVAFGSEISDGILERLFALHGLRFASMNRPTAFTSSRLGLLRDLAGMAGADRGPMAVLASAGDRIVGVDLSFVFGRRLAGYQSGWSLEFEHWSLGMVMLYLSMEWGRSHGVESVDLLRGKAEYKLKVGAVEKLDGVYLRADGIGGRLLRLKHRLRP